MVFLITLVIICFFISKKVIESFPSKKIEYFEKKIILITGCDTGIGKQCAKFLYELGFIIFACVLDENSDGAFDFKNKDKYNSKRIKVIKLDITDESSIYSARSLVNNFINKNSGVKFHCLVNNAGICILGEFDWLTLDHINNTIDVNLKGTLMMIRSFSQILIKHQGRIIIVGSLNGIYSYPGISVYCSTKFALNAFGQSLRFELHKLGVKVCILNPGDYSKKTNIIKNQNMYFEQMRNSFDDFKNKVYGKYFNVIVKSFKNFNISSSFDNQNKFDKKLFLNFEKMATYENPPLQVLIMPFIQKMLLNFFFFLPISIQLYLYDLVMNKIVFN